MSETFVGLIAIAVVTISAAIIHFLLRFTRIVHWAISFPLASLLCYCSFCSWFLGCPFPLYLEGHDFGILTLMGRPISFLLILLLGKGWLPNLQVAIMLPLLVMFQYLLLGGLIDRIVKIVKNRKMDSASAGGT